MHDGDSAGDDQWSRWTEFINCLDLFDGGTPEDNDRTAHHYKDAVKVIA